MGNNLVGLNKILANPKEEITESDFESVWQQFSRKDNYGIISLNRCKRFSQNLSLSLYKPYNPNSERNIRIIYDRESKGYLTKDYFFHFFVQKLKEENYKFNSVIQEKFRQIDLELGSDFELNDTNHFFFNSKDSELIDKSVSFIYPKNMLKQKIVPNKNEFEEIIDLKYLADDNRHFHSLSNSCWVKSKGKYYSW